MRVWISDTGYIMYNKDEKSLDYFIDIFFPEVADPLWRVKNESYWMLLE